MGTKISIQFELDRLLCIHPENFFVLLDNFSETLKSNELLETGQKKKKRKKEKKRKKKRREGKSQLPFLQPEKYVLDCKR